MHLFSPFVLYLGLATLALILIVSFADIGIDFEISLNLVDNCNCNPVLLQHERHLDQIT